MRIFTLCALTCAALLVSGLAFAGPFADATADALWGVEIGGYLDIGYTYNFNNPNNGNNANVGRAFDGDHNDFDFNAFQLYFDRLPQDAGEAGIRLDFMFGEDAAGLSQPGDIFDGDDFNIYQAFVSYIADVGNGLTIDVGRFATWHGYEVIESPANDHYSRSLAFTHAVPFTHTGLRLTYPVNDMVELTGGVTQGWDVVEDDNDAKTIHAAVRIMPNESLYIQPSIAYGAEEGVTGEQTLLLDLVVTYNLTEDWLIGCNIDWVQADRGAEDDELLVLAGYLRYDVNEDLYLALRGEWLDSQEADGPAGDIEGWEATFTVGYDVVENLQTRLEYRHDDSGQNVFDLGTDDSQDTIAAEVIYSF
jgi:hypothetical protein